MELSMPCVMGIINITPDSFLQEAVKIRKEILERANQILEEGGTIIDIGGQSTSPSSVYFRQRRNLTD